MCRSCYFICSLSFFFFVSFGIFSPHDFFFLGFDTGICSYSLHLCGTVDENSVEH